MGTELALAACTPVSPLCKEKRCGMSTAVGEGVSTSESVLTSAIKLANEVWSDNIWASIYVFVKEYGLSHPPQFCRASCRVLSGFLNHCIAKLRNNIATQPLYSRFVRGFCRYG